MLELEGVADTMFVVLTCGQIVGTCYETSFWILDPWVCLWGYEALPLIFREPAFFHIDSLSHIVFAFRKKSTYLEAYVTI